MRKFVLIALVLLSTLVVVAQPKPHVVDRAHSQINFVGEARFLSAHGFFGQWEADVQLDPAKIENSTLSITIDAASLNTRVERRDTHLRSADFFSVEQFPKITFVSKKIERTGEKKLNVVGDFTLRGVARELAVPLTMLFYENGRGRFRGSFELNRKDFGMSYNSRMNPVEDVVLVQVDINVIDREMAQRPRPPAAPPTAPPPPR